MPGSVAHALATTLSERVMAMRLARSSGVEARHDDPERCGREDEETLDPLTTDDHRDEQHDAERDRDDGIGAVERPEPSHREPSLPDARGSRNPHAIIGRSPRLVGL